MRSTAWFPSRWPALPASLLLASCTILAPVQTPADDRRFPLKAVSDTERQGRMPCGAGPITDTECAALEVDIDSFHGGLGRAMWEMDRRRRELVARAAEHTNMNSLYNALLWPVGAYFVEKKIRRPTWSALDTAAVAAATYGLLNSGIPDRDKLYLKTSARMACTMVEFDADLYPEREIRPFPHDAHDADDGGDPPILPGDTLQERLERLEQRLQQFIEQRDRVLMGIKLDIPAAGLRGRTQAEQARLDALGRTAGGKKLSDPTADFSFETDTLLNTARQQLDEAGKLKVQLDSAGARMRLQRSRIEAALAQGLNDRTPELRQPMDVGRELAQAFAQGISSERSLANRVAKQSGSGRAEEWWPTQARMAALTPDTRPLVTNFWLQERENLKRAMAQMDKWKARHDERVRLSKADAAAMGCNEGSLADFTQSLLKPLTAPVPAASASSP